MGETPSSPVLSLIELAACPFCGGAGSSLAHGSVTDPDDDDGRIWFVACKCGATFENYTSEAEAVAGWNRRARATEVPHVDQ